MTYLQLVNSVLVRLREEQVASVANTAYSSMIGQFVNDAKRQVEDAFNWDALAKTIDITTVAGTRNYTVAGSGIRHKNISCNNITSKYELQPAPIQWIIDQFDLTTPASGSPTHYAWNGNNGTDSKVEIYPSPDGAYSLRFHLYAPQPSLSADSTAMLVPSEPVIMGAYAMAAAERGEDQGLSSSEAFALFRNSLSDHIALESSRFIENSQWVAV